MMAVKGELMNTARRWSFILFLFVFGCARTPSQPAASIYNEKADAHRDIDAAIANAEGSRRNIVLIFGANWCPDCHALDAQIHKAELASLLKENFVVVEVDVGRYDKNLDLADQYHVPVTHGIPALAVLDPHGRLLYAMDQGQFADARHMSYESIKEFFVKWEPVSG